MTDKTKTKTKTKKTADKPKTKKSTEKLTKKKGKKSKEARAKEREEKREARKGDGSFPDILVVTKQKEKGKEDGEKTKVWFLGHGEDMATLYKNDETVAVYKLRRVSKMVISRKVAR